MSTQIISIKALCEQLNALERHSKTVNENIRNFYAQGLVGPTTQAIIKKIIGLVDRQYQSLFILNIDDEWVPFANFSTIDKYLEQAPYTLCFELTVQKKQLIQRIYSANDEIDEILYTSLPAFQSAQNGLSLKTPFLRGMINQDPPTRIHVFGLAQAFGGPRLSVVPVESNDQPSNWPLESQLPTCAAIHRQIHVVSPEHIIVNPQRFELSWGALDSEAARPFRVAYAQHLFVALCSAYYTDENVELRRGWQASIVSDGLAVDADRVSALAHCVKWSYGHEIPEKPIHLLIDCLFTQSSRENLLELTGNALRMALEIAKQQVITDQSDHDSKFDPVEYGAWTNKNNH